MTVDQQLISSIGRGVLVFAAVAPDDTEKEAENMAAKILKFKLWPDDQGGNVWNNTGIFENSTKTGIYSGNETSPILMVKSCVVGLMTLRRPQGFFAQIWTVSQFTLLASTKKGSKPDFHGAAGGDHARRLYEHFFRKIQELHRTENVKDGVFQAMMEVGLVNDGPVGHVYLSYCSTSNT